MGWLDRFKRAPEVSDETDHGRAMTPPVYKFGQFRTGISSSEQQPSAAQLVTDGFTGIQATAARAIANRVGDLEFKVQERTRAIAGTTEWEDNDEHPLLAPLERPNPLLSRRQLLKLTSYWLTQSGEAFWLIITNGAGAARELWPMSPRFIEKLASDALPVSGYIFHGQGGEVLYSPSEVVWIYDPDPADPFAGVGIVGPQARDFDSSTFASDTVRQHYKNDATPKIVLKATGDAMAPDAKQKDAFYADWINRFNRRSGQDQGLPAFTPTGFDVQELAGASNVEEARAMMEFLRNNLLMANGVPRSILGDVVDANRAAADTNRLVFDRHTIKPQAGLIADALTHQLAVPLFGTDTRIAFTEFISEDEDLRLREEAQDLSLKVRSVNQVRADRGIDDVEWGELPVGSFADTPYDGAQDDDPEPNPFDSTSDPGANPFETGDDPDEPEPDDEPDDDSEELEPEEGRALIVARAHKRITANFTPARAWGRALQLESQNVPRMVSGLRKVFAGQRALTLDALAKEPDLARAWAVEGFGRADFVDALFEGVEFTKLFDFLVTPIREEVYKRAGENVLLGLEHKPILSFDEAAIKTMRAQGAELVTLANATTKRSIRTTLAKGIALGENAEKMAARVRKVYSVASKSRSRTIARTEVGHAISSGQLAGYEASGVVARKQWNTALDDRVRDTHGGPGHLLDGVQVDVASAFTLLDGEKAMAPKVAVGGGRLSAHNGINCRCFSTPVVEE